MLVWVVALLLGASNASAALEDRNLVYVGAGALTDGIAKAASSSDGSTGIISSLLPTLNATVWFNKTGILGFGFNSAFTPIGRPASDGSASIHIWTLNLPVTFRLAAFDFKAAAGLMYYFYFGKGGTVDLNNGSTTATFARPSRTASTRLLMLNLGFAMHIFERIRVEADLITVGLGTDRRAFTIMLSGAYGFF